MANDVFPNINKQNLSKNLYKLSYSNCFINYYPWISWINIFVHETYKQTDIYKNKLYQEVYNSCNIKCIVALKKKKERNNNLS